MSVSQRIRGVKVLKAVSSSLRLQILNLLFDRGSLSYTELMNSLKMNPNRDAGRFAYHLKFLGKADLIEADAETKKYGLTELGKMIIDVADRVEKRAAKPRGMLVRASRFALEEFDVNRIANSLIREAGMPAELAQKTAREAEKRLLKSKAKYVTAPLVREVANAILLENGLEDYRHKLTRLGLPVHEVFRLINEKSKPFGGAASVCEAAGEAVLGEYMLLNVFPRDIGDAHLSGSIHVGNMSSWILKPEEVVHDVRKFLQHGTRLSRAGDSADCFGPPQDFESALSTILNVLIHSSREVNGTQMLEYFNVFLAPFARGLEFTTIREKMRSFILNASQHASFCISLEFTIPDFIADKPATGADGKAAGKYGDFSEEAQHLASAVLDVLCEENRIRPLPNPSLMAKIRSETFSDKRAEALLLRAHRLASEAGTVYFAVLLGKENQKAVFCASGSKLRTDFSEDWEIDTLRTGCLGVVSVNLPRIAYECEDSTSKFFELLKERLDLATRALDLKSAALKQRGEGLISFLSQKTNGDQYFRLEGSSSLVNLLGVKESIEALFGKKASQDEKTAKFLDELASHVSTVIDKAGRRRGRRLLPATLLDPGVSERLAQLDVDRYGFGKVTLPGGREKPHYSTITELTIQDEGILSELPQTEQVIKQLQVGGSLAVIHLGKVEISPDQLLLLTKQAIEKHKLDLFTYTRKLTYCANCRKSWFGLLRKCPECDAVSALSFSDRHGLA